MHAVVLMVTINDPEAAISKLREEVVPVVKQAPGLVTGHWTRVRTTRGSGWSSSSPRMPPTRRASERRRWPTLTSNVTLESAGVRAGSSERLSLAQAVSSYLMWTPEIAREMTRRWISEVPSKIV